MKTIRERNTCTVRCKKCGKTMSMMMAPLEIYENIIEKRRRCVYVNMVIFVTIDNFIMFP